MSDLPKPSSWPSAFLTACGCIFFGSIALQLSLEILGPLLPTFVRIIVAALAMVVLLVSAGAIRRWWRGRSEW